MVTAEDLEQLVDRRAPRPPVRTSRARPRLPWWRIAVGALLWTVVAVGGLAYATSLAVPLWYEVHGQRLLIVTSGSMAPRFVAGDVVVLRAITDASELKVDQVVTFRPVGSDSLVTHRIVELHQLPALQEDAATGRMVPVLDGDGNAILQPYIVTQGDANSSPDPNATPVRRTPTAVRPQVTQLRMHAQTTAGGRTGSGPTYGAGQTWCGGSSWWTGCWTGGTGDTGATGRGASRTAGSSLNQVRAGCSHSISVDAAITAGMKPPVTMPAKNSGTASTVTSSRAARLRRSTW